MIILVLGGSGLVGNGIRMDCYYKTTPDEYIYASSSDCDLTNEENTYTYFETVKPDKVIHLAAYVGGLYRNLNEKVQMLNVNTAINTNVLKACHKYKVNRCVCCLSTCIFPDKTEYPINEEMLNDGPPHSSNYPYAYAKRMLSVGCQAYNEQYPDGCQFICVIPTNIYGPYDNFDLENAHVIPALIHKCHLAKEANKDFVVCGTGKPLRQFVFSVDIGRMILHVLENYIPDTNNLIILSLDESTEISIADVARLIAKEYNWEDRMRFDLSFADGQYKKTADNKKWTNLFSTINPITNIECGIRRTVKWFLENKNSSIRGVNTVVENTTDGNTTDGNITDGNITDDICCC
jgi:GDP-L-fucose synthase